MSNYKKHSKLTFYQSLSGICCVACDEVPSHICRNLFEVCLFLTGDQMDALLLERAFRVPYAYIDFGHLTIKLRHLGAYWTLYINYE